MPDIIPFPFTREQFDKLKLEPCALFPIKNYDFCKLVYETSPLIQELARQCLEDSPNPT